jgi:hypothetical protein
MDTITHEVKKPRLLFYPAAIALDERLDRYARDLYLFLLNCQFHGIASVGFKTLLKHMGCSKTKVPLAIEQLRCFGYIEILSTGQELGKYRLIDPSNARFSQELLVERTDEAKVEPKRGTVEYQANIPPSERPGTVAKYRTDTTRRYWPSTNTKSNLLSKSIPKLLNSQEISSKLSSKEILKSSTYLGSVSNQSDNSFHTADVVTQRQTNDPAVIPKDQPKQKPELLPWQKQIFHSAAALGGETLKSLLPTEGLQTACRFLALACSKASDSEASVLCLSQQLVNIVINGTIGEPGWGELTFRQFFAVCRTLKRADIPLDLDTLDHAIQSLKQPVGRS